MTTHFSILTWRIPWTEEPDRLQSMGLQRVGHDGVMNTFTFIQYRNQDIDIDTIKAKQFYQFNDTLFFLYSLNILPKPYSLSLKFA